MATNAPPPNSTSHKPPDEHKDAAETATEATAESAAKAPTWRKFLAFSKAPRKSSSSGISSDGDDVPKKSPEKWSLGVLNDKETDEVPGSVLLMSNNLRNEPLGLENAPARTSASSLPSPFPPHSRPSSDRPSSRRRHSTQPVEEKKRTRDGKMILDPQPDDSLNDPLNWPAWRRDVALVSLGFYCMLGGGMTPVLAAGFSNVAASYHVSIPQVALTTGLYMLGLGLGSVVMSPTAIIYGKRPVYLLGIILFILSAIWCALSPNYPSLIVARIFMGLAVSPVECLPSATIAEIFYLHERAHRLGIYTLLLLSGKNLIPLVSAAIIQGLDWQWVFWIVAMVVATCFVAVFFFVPETFWDRTPRPHVKGKRHPLASLSKVFHHGDHEKRNIVDFGGDGALDLKKLAIGNSGTIAERRQEKNAHHVGFTDAAPVGKERISASGEIEDKPDSSAPANQGNTNAAVTELGPTDVEGQHPIASAPPRPQTKSLAGRELAAQTSSHDKGAKTPSLHNFNSPYYVNAEKLESDYLNHKYAAPGEGAETPNSGSVGHPLGELGEKSPYGVQRYTTYLRTQPPKTYLQTLKPWNGKLRYENWFLVALRPFILFAYPAILWSSLVYALSIGWLIVLSETVTTIYRNKESYNFTSLQTGLVYISPFIGGILGTAVAGKFSDLIVRYMSRRNGGVYEPEFRLVMAIPVTIATCIGLMGFGWSAEERDNFMVPTVFFGIISFGCSLGSTTSITFAVDSYRQYAGEALVTLNFSKNIFHGLVFSLFFNNWLDADGSKKTFVAVGGIQLACLATTIPMYIYGKRARMWTVRRNLMEKF